MTSIAGNRNKKLKMPTKPYTDKEWEQILKESENGKYDYEVDGDGDCLSGKDFIELVRIARKTHDITDESDS